MTPLQWIQGGWKTSPYAKTETAGFGIDVDGLYGFQCKDLVQAFSIFLGHPFTNGNAITLLNPQAGWSWVTSPQIGDVFVRHAVFGSIDYGDTGIVESVTSTGVNVLQQNLAADLYHGSPPAQMFWKFNQLIGYLRSGGSMATDKLDKDEIAAIYQLAFDNDDYPQDLIDAYTGKPLDGYIQQLLNDPSYKAHKQQVNNPSTPGFKPAPELYVKE